jgi:hypothetical protein
MGGREIMWKALKVMAILFAVLWALYVTVLLKGLSQQEKLTCQYAASAARNADRAHGLISDLPYACP